MSRYTWHANHSLGDTECISGLFRLAVLAPQLPCNAPATRPLSGAVRANVLFIPLRTSIEATPETDEHAIYWKGQPVPYNHRLVILGK
jgi:hypothetical protein